MKRVIAIFVLACICIGVYAQTPYDSFAPETSRPILEIKLRAGSCHCLVNNRKDCDYEKRKTIVKTDCAIYSVPYAMYKLHGADMPKLR